MLIRANTMSIGEVSLPDVDFPPGMFGENLTTEGLSEQTVLIGDRFRNRRGGGNRDSAATALL